VVPVVVVMEAAAVAEGALHLRTRRPVPRPLSGLARSP
jgi:hypothetical protein